MHTHIHATPILPWLLWNNCPFAVKRGIGGNGEFLMHYREDFKFLLQSVLSYIQIGPLNYKVSLINKNVILLLAAVSLLPVCFTIMICLYLIIFLLLLILSEVFFIFYFWDVVVLSAWIRAVRGGVWWDNYILAYNEIIICFFPAKSCFVLSCLLSIF